MLLQSSAMQTMRIVYPKHSWDSPVLWEEAGTQVFGGESLRVFPGYAIFSTFSCFVFLTLIILDKGF